MAGSPPHEPLALDRSGAGEEAAAPRTEQALREAHERLRVHVEAMPLGVVEWDQEFRVRSMSPRAEQILGWSAAEVIGKRIDEIPWIPPEDWPAVRAVMRDMASGARPSNVNANRNVRGDGAVVSCEWYNTTVHDASGRLASVLSLVLDVTARARAEAALRESEERLRLALAATQDAVWDIDLATGVVRWNETYAARYGRPPSAETSWQWWIDRIHPEDRERVAGGLRAAVDGDATGWTCEYRFRAVGGGWVDLLDRAVIARDGAGRATRVVGAMADVTERRRAERALREADRNKTRFLSVLSHELRNPLAPIRNGIQLLERSAPDSPQAARAREVIRRQTEHLTRLVDDLLEVTRISHGKIVLQRRRLDLRDVVRTTADDLHGAFEAAGVQLRVQADARPVWVEADPTRIAQVLGNLLTNAVKFTPSGGAVTASVAAVGGRAELRVRDTGVGMDPATLAGLFEPFAQGDQSLARSTGGLGLGLALVKGLVEAHGGVVAAGSGGEGRGAEFTVRLPLAEAGEAERPGGSRAAPAGRSILVIEDNADAGQSLADLLELDGHRVSLAPGGRSGLERARAERPEVVLCDIGLPDLDGYEVARALRADPALSGTRLIALSGYAQPEDRERALQAGFDAHLAKPPDPEALSRMLAAPG